MKKTVKLGMYKGKYDKRSKGFYLEVEIRNNVTDYDRRDIDLNVIPAGTVVKELSIVGYAKQSEYSDWAFGGQCIDGLDYVTPIKPFTRANIKRIRQIWERYHLNDMHAGTRKQEETLKEFNYNSSAKESWYTQAFLHLKSKGLLEDNGYRYGKHWLIEIIPDEVLEEVKNLFGLEDTENESE